MFKVLKDRLKLKDLEEEKKNFDSKTTQVTEETQNLKNKTQKFQNWLNLMIIKKS